MEPSPSRPAAGADALVRGTLRLEEAASLDAAARIVEPFVRRAFATGARGAVLRGDWLGHALHPSLTDVVVGSWTSATVLDLVGGPASAPASRRLVGLGLLLAGPTAWSGWAQWCEAGQREKRVGLVHAASVGGAVTAYAASWRARGRGQRARGTLTGLAGAALLTAGGYLGGHLAVARGVGTRDPAFGPAPGGRP